MLSLIARTWETQKDLETAESDAFAAPGSYLASSLLVELQNPSSEEEDEKTRLSWLDYWPDLSLVSLGIAAVLLASPIKPNGVGTFIEFRPPLAVPRMRRSSILL
jgi:hypothetical protein